MKQNRSVQTATSFNNLDLHDDALASVRIRAPRSKTALTTIDFELLDDSTGAKKVVSFRGCSNLRFIMDFDVLADNWYAQTKSTTSRTDLRHLQKFVQSQIAHWRVKYMAPSPKNKPIRKKLSTMRSSYVLFKLNFFGGTVEVLAKNFAVKRSRRA